MDVVTGKHLNRIYEELAELRARVEKLEND